jgi:uncharacterized protein YjiS (DUF1127 family)
MITQIKTFLEVTLRNFGRNRLRSQLLSCSDHVLEDMGFSRELLLQGVSAWPWRLDGEQNEAKVYSIFSKHEKEIRQAINELESYTDRELSDIGIVRCDIESIVRNGSTYSDTNFNDPDQNGHQPKAA